MSPPGIGRRPFLQTVATLGGLGIASQYSNASLMEDPKPIRVMIDAYHSHTWIDTKPTSDLFDYHKLHGLGRLHGFMEQLGWQTHLQLFGPWTEKILSAHDVVLLNLVSMDQPPFYVSEIRAIRSYLEQGGGLVLITDHSNCYYHAHVLGPLLRELDIRIPTYTACDVGEQQLCLTTAWIAIHDFDRHPITHGIECIAYQCGGCVDDRFAIAWTSQHGWGDHGATAPYGEGISMGLFGDLARSPVEPEGKQGVVLAKQIGKGRIAIVADQNAFGSIFLGYADNLPLFLQATRWAAGDKGDAIEIPLPPESDRSLVWCYEPLKKKRYFFGNLDEDGFYAWYGWMTRFVDPRATDRPQPAASLLIVHEESLELDEEAIVAAVRVLERGKGVVVVGKEGESRKEAWLSKMSRSLKTIPSQSPLKLDCRGSDSQGKVYWIEEPNRVSNRGIGQPEKETKGAQREFEQSLARWMLSVV